MPGSMCGVLTEDKYLQHDWKAKLRGFWFRAGWYFSFVRVTVANNSRVPNLLEYKFRIDGANFAWESVRTLTLKGKKVVPEEVMDGL